MMFVMGNIIGLSQSSMSEYSFIQVPDTFEFLRGSDQYQMNSLTKFLFNKHGFNAYFSNELPNVLKCDGLYAEVDGSPGFIYTRITVIVKDCRGNELFRSEEGKSKYKEYKRAYQDAVRKAFRSFEGLGIKQKDIVARTSNSSVTETQEEKEENIETIPEEIVKNPTPTAHIPEARFLNYTRNGNAYLLRKTTDGFSLYAEQPEAEVDLIFVGKLVVTNDQISYTPSNGPQYNAYFTESSALVIEKPDGNVTYALVRN